VKLTFNWNEQARAELRALPRDEALRILHELTRFARTGRGDIKALHGPLAGTHRLRVGPWRVQFRTTQPDTIQVIAIEKRGDAYRD
jgi:mRNA-degrading endonuclease RelE of RelBE toxin-antitoxin system